MNRTLYGVDEGTEEQNVELDAEAEELLADLAASQAEVQAMLREQREQADELGGLKDQLTNEVRHGHHARLIRAWGAQLLCHELGW